MTPIFSCLRGMLGFLPASSLKSSSKSAVKKEKKSWAYLPVEIRELILDVLMRDGCSLASLATVSREWQTTIEKHNFARIRVTPSRLPELNSMTLRNRALVKYIWVCLELGKYPCPVRNNLNLGARQRITDDNIVTITALQDLFPALSKWEPRGDLVLDISFYSPSDSEHCFKELTFVPDFDSPDECDRALCGTAEAKIARIKNGAEASAWTRAPPSAAIRAAFLSLMQGDPFEDVEQWLKWFRRLPRAPAVTRLLLRQQSRRQFQPWLVALMTELLPGIREMYYEPWRDWDDEQQRLRDAGESCYHSLFSFGAPLRGMRSTKFLRLLPPFCFSFESWGKA